MIRSINPKELIKNQNGSTMIYAMLLGSAVIGLSIYGWNSLNNYRSEEKKNVQATEVQRSFENIKRYMSLRRICDFHMKEFNGEDPRKPSEKAFDNLVTVNTLGLSGRTISKLSYDKDGKLITDRSLPRVLGISFFRPALEPRSIKIGPIIIKEIPINASFTLEVKYGECKDSNNNCTQSELVERKMKMDIPVEVLTKLDGKQVESVNCQIPQSDLQKEAIAKACTGVGGLFDEKDQSCKFPIYDPCKTFREDTIDIEKFKSCMSTYVNKTLSATSAVSFEDAVCRLDLITANNSAKASKYEPAILAKNPETGQTEIKEGSNTGKQWLVTTKYCRTIKAWKKLD